jgi:hypothetical protein
LFVVALSAMLALVVVDSIVVRIGSIAVISLIGFANVYTILHNRPGWFGELKDYMSGRRD